MKTHTSWLETSALSFRSLSHPFRHGPTVSARQSRAALGKLLFFTLSFAVVGAIWSSESYAARQNAVGPGIIPLNADGTLSGVDMSASGTTGTLTVGTIGGPDQDIFTLNNPPVAGLVAVSTSASSQGNIQFNSGSTVYGDIGVTQPGGPFLLNITGANTGTTVKFNGGVFATTLNVVGTGTVNFNNGGNNITATNYAADGTIVLAPNTTVIGALTTTAGAQTGTLVLGGGSTLDGAVGGAVGLKTINVVGGSNTAGVSANISGAVDAYAFSLGTNTLNIGGALTIANLGPSGVVNTTLAGPTVYGNIRPVGATNLGPTLAVNVTVPSSALIPVGTIFNIVQTQTGTTQSGTDGSVVNVSVQDPTNPLYTFSAVPLAGTIKGLVAIQVTGVPLLVPITPPPPGVVLPPVTPVAAVVAPVLVAVTPPPPPPTGVVAPPPVVLPVVIPPAAPVAPTSDLATVVLPAINALTTPDAVVDAVAQLAPGALSLAAPLQTFRSTRLFQALPMSYLDGLGCGQIGERQRLDDPEGTDTSTCPANTKHDGLWLKGVGYFGSQDARQAFQGYDARTVGMMIGYDGSVGPGTRLGLAVGYAKSNIEGKTSASHTDFNTYQAMAYVTHEEGPWYVYGDVSLGLNNYTGVRRVSFPGLDRIARADYNGEAYTGYMTSGYHFFVDAFAITPFASLQYTRMNLDSYGEAGGGDINLAVQSQNYDFLESGLGMKVAHPFTDEGKTYIPEVHIRWLRELNNPVLANTAAFQIAPSVTFTTPGMGTPKDTYNVGAGLALLSCGCKGNNWSLKAVYDYYWNSGHYSAHEITAKFTYHL